MHCTVDSTQLTKALRATDKATAKRMSLAVLQCVLLEATNETLTVRATNLDIGIEVQLPARVKESGVVAVPGDVLGSLLASGVTGDVTLALEDTTLNVKTKTTHTSINTHNADDFPRIPRLTGGTTLTIGAAELLKGCKSVWYAAATSVMKPELASVAVRYVNGKMVFVATDSFRLAEKQVSVRNVAEFDTFLIPVVNVSELVRNLEDRSGDVVLTITDSQIACQFEDTYITSRIVDGVFPDYGQIIPKEFTTEVTILKADFVTALKTSAIFANKFNQIHFDIAPSDKRFSLQTSNSDIGAAETTLSAALEGDDLEIRFNYRYINDALQSITADSVVLQFSGVGKPMIMRGVGDNSFTYLTMPMNR